VDKKSRWRAQEPCQRFSFPQSLSVLQEGWRRFLAVFYPLQLEIPMQAGQSCTLSTLPGRGAKARVLQLYI